MNLIGPINSGSASGGAGVATSNADSSVVVSGILLGIYVTYNGSPPAGTTDAIVTTRGTTPYAPSETLLSVTNAATDAWFYPRTNIDNTSGSSQGAVWDYIPIHDFVNVEIAGANDADSIDVWIMVDG